ncbi:uncharacterized protein EMH_0092610 [Eimeria mitis]|uniref:Uncharacterized protein n=1 Tax=Eimeria mitis TaxID=44415 RepID=U6KER9_9EIME|nr:uncharacterized protein EMH_0092610 [Eimeria mitis]CDJ34752.1 hypothetical protein, conserved [Eimeria mitis]
MLKVARDATKIESACSDEIKAIATAALRMQYQREHASIHRELAEQLGKLRILCKVERRRRKLLPKQDVSVLEALDGLEDQLKRGEQQLEEHKAMVERMEEAEDIISSRDAEKLARRIGNSLEALLEAAASSRSSIPGALSEGEAAQSEVMQRYLKFVAMKTNRDAAAERERAVSILNKIDVQMPDDSAFPLKQEGAGQNQPPLSTLRSSTVTKQIFNAPRQVGDANTAMRKTVHAEEAKQESSSSSDASAEELLRAARTAAKASEAFGQEAEHMWLCTMLKNSVGLDMQLSVALAQRSTALVGMETGDVDQEQQRWHVEMPSDDMQEFGNMLMDFTNIQEEAQSANGLDQVASAAVAMKQAALKLTTFVAEHQGQLTIRKGRMPRSS